MRMATAFELKRYNRAMGTCGRGNMDLTEADIERMKAYLSEVRDMRRSWRTFEA